MKFFWHLICTAFVLGVALCFPKLVFAGEAVYKTNFESPQDWNEVHNAQLSFPERPCRDASGDLEWTKTEHGFGTKLTQANPCFAVLLGPNIFDENPRSLEITWDWRIIYPAQDRNFILSWQDQNNWLGIHLFEHSIYVEGKKNGVILPIPEAKGPYPFQANTTYHFRARVNQDSKKVFIWVNDVLVNEATVDPLPEFPPKFGLAASVGHGVRSSESYFSNLKVFALPEKVSPPLLKQVSAPWSDEVYNSANVWAPKHSSISRWGCALVSSSMLLQFYGITTLPDGNALTPASLNNWLKKEPDGYLGEGHLNWRALTRVAKWHTGRFSTASLEFSRHQPAEAEKITWLQEKLERRIPVILEQQGHFVLAYAWDVSTQTALIHDPGFQRRSLAEYNNTYVSARLFTPSATNLQGAVIVLPTGITPTLRDQRGQSFPILPLEQGVFDVAGELTNTNWQLWDVGPWGGRQLELRINTWSPTPVSIAQYSLAGDVAVWHGILRGSQSIAFNTLPDSESLSDLEFAQLVSWDEIRSPALWYWRNAWLDTAEQNSTTNQQYSWLLQQARTNTLLSASAYALLQTEIQKERTSE